MAFSAVVSSQAMQTTNAGASHTKAATGEASNHANKAEDKTDAGAITFDKHCARCHNAPESFSPRISGTILRHMRVRASLSKQEEQDILRFLNP